MTKFNETNINSVFCANSFVVTTELTTYFIDPQPQVELYQKWLNQPFKILYTHGHCDHIRGAYLFGKHSFCRGVYAHPSDKNKFYDGHTNYSKKVDGQAWGFPKDLEIKETKKLDDPNLTIIDAPGHTHGSIVIVIPKQKLIFSGDTFFADSVGNFQINEDQVLFLKTLKSLYNSLPEDFLVCSGHGRNETMGKIKKTNQLFNWCVSQID